MALENLVGPDKFVSALVAANPTGGDDKREGDDHIRGVKNVILNTFPNINGAVTMTDEELNSVTAKVNRAGDTMSGNLTVSAVVTAYSAKLSPQAVANPKATLSIEAYLANLQYYRAWGVSGSGAEPSTYSFGLNCYQVAEPGFPQHTYAFECRAYAGFNGETATVIAETGVWSFAKPIVNGSDERLKSNWSEMLPRWLDRLAGVKSGSYDYAAGGTVSRQVGVSAQDMQGVLPEAVSADAKGWLSVAYGNAALVACVELAREVKALRSRVALLEAMG